jgi:hypothetical protein
MIMGSLSLDLGRLPARRTKDCGGLGLHRPRPQLAHDWRIRHLNRGHEDHDVAAFERLISRVRPSDRNILRFTAPVASWTVRAREDAVYRYLSSNKVAGGTRWSREFAARPRDVGTGL